MLYQVWGSGFISQELTLLIGGLIQWYCGSVSQCNGFRITIEPLLPPIVTYDGTTQAIDLEMGELYIAIHNGDYNLKRYETRIYTHIFAP